MLNYDPNNPPSCGVVVEKQGDQETICPERAANLWNLTDPDNPNVMVAMILACPRHSAELEEGKSLIFLADNKVDRIGVQFVPEGGKE